MEIKKYKDTINGFEAEATSKIMAWMLIRNKCKDLDKNIPSLEEIKLECNHLHIKREDGLDECLDCGAKNY
jgi:hypothetical protein